jgi:hypothetical protein
MKKQFLKDRLYIGNSNLIVRCTKNSFSEERFTGVIVNSGELGKNIWPTGHESDQWNANIFVPYHELKKIQEPELNVIL